MHLRSYCGHMVIGALQICYDNDDDVDDDILVGQNFLNVPWITQNVHSTGQQIVFLGENW